jgi:6-phosphogluconolactonase
MTRSVLKFNDGPAVAEAAAAGLLKELGGLLATQPEVHLSITGGTVGILTLAKIAEHERCADLAWNRVHIWWGDERFVAADSSERNAVQASEALLSALPLDPAKVHEFPAFDPESEQSIDDQLEAAASSFAEHVSSHLAVGVVLPYFDITVLGMGPDGHIDSLFPGSQIPAEGSIIYAEHSSPKPPPKRLTFTYEAVNNSGQVWFVVSGADKADAVAVAFGSDPRSLPVGRVSAINQTVWFIDEAAAAQI